MKRSGFLGIALALLATPAAAADYFNSFNGNDGAVFSDDALVVIDMDKGAKFCGPMTMVNGLRKVITLASGTCMTVNGRTKLSLKDGDGGDCTITNDAVNGMIIQGCSIGVLP